VAQSPSTGGAFWPTLEVHGDAVSPLRFNVMGGLKEGGDYTYRQWKLGGGLELQAKPFDNQHLIDIDPAREHRYVLEAAYEYLETTEGATPDPENRVALAVTPQARPGSEWLLSDRNQIEFRWVGGAYSSRYRNRVGVDYGTRIGSLRLTPYAQAEFFYDITKDSWNEERYTVGIEWPFRRILKLSTYYTRQVCQEYSPEFVNVAGVTLHYFVGNDR